MWHQVILIWGAIQEENLLRSGLKNSGILSVFLLKGASGALPFLDVGTGTS